MNTNTLSYISTFKGALLFLFLAHNLLPVVGYYTPASVYFANVVALFCIYFLFNGSNLQSAGSFVVPFIVLFFVTSPGIFSSGYEFGYQLYGQMQEWFWPMLGFYVLTRNRIHEAKYICTLTLIMCIITCITTIIGVQNFPGASRILATDIKTNNPFYILYVTNNIAGFAFTYMVTALLSIIICFWKWKHLNTFVAFGLALLVLVYTIETEYTTAVLVSVVTCVLFFINRDLNSKKLFTIIIIGILASLFLQSQLSDVIGSASGNTESVILQERLSELSTSMNGEETTGDWNIRQNLFQNSIDGFLRSPLTGGGGAGGHSYILDMLANWGLIGGGLLFWIYRRIYDWLYRPFKNEPFFGYMLFGYITCIFLAIFNTYPNWFALTCLIPFSGMWLRLLLRQKRLR